MVITTCRNVKDLSSMMLARRGRRPKLRFCLKMGTFGVDVCYIFLSFRINNQLQRDVYFIQMTNANWLNFDAELLQRLGDVRKGIDVSMGKRYTRRFYGEFAPKLAEITGYDMTAKDVMDRVDRLRRIYNDCKDADVFQHDVMDNVEFRYHMKRCFGPTNDAPLRIPRTVNLVLGSRLSSRGAGSGGSGSSVSNEQMHFNQPTDLDLALGRLHAGNRLRFDGHKLTLFTRLLKRDPQLSSMFMGLQTADEMLDFIDDQRLQRFDL